MKDKRHTDNKKSSAEVWCEIRNTTWMEFNNKANVRSTQVYTLMSAKTNFVSLSLTSAKKQVK